MNGAEEVFPGSGEMAHLMRAHDWERSGLGHPSGWPRELRTCVQVCLESRFPIVLWWGPELRLIYNDAWRPALGALKHPAIGRPGQEVWAEIWHIIGPQLAGVVETGEATWSTDMLLPMDRYGYREETYWTYSYSPIRDEDGTVCGVFTPVTETTQRVISARRLRMLQRLGEAGSGRSVEEACALAIEMIGRDPADIPFARIYLAEDGVARAVAATQGVPAEVPEGAVDLHHRDGPWPWASVRETGAPAVVALEAGGDVGQDGWGLPRMASVHALGSPTEAGPIGLLVAGISPGRSHDDAYRDFLALVAQNAATLMVNATALDDERRRARGLAALQNLTAALSEALTPSAVAGALIDIGLPLLGGVAGGLMVIDDDARVLRSVRLGGYPDGSADQDWRIPLAERTPLTDAVRHRAIQHAESSDEAVRHWPSMEAFRIAHALDGALAAVPVVSGGRALGALAVRYPQTGPLGDDARRLLETVARLTGPALLRSSHYILQHSVAETLQRSLLPLHLPSVGGLRVAAGYTAAGEGIEAGGDWYDAIELPGGRLALMVGDVVGRGPRAAAVMGQLRSALRAFAIDQRDGPGETVANLSRFASTIDGADVATACYAELDVAERRLRYVCAGHPPPLVLSADGGTHYLEGGRGVPLGVREPGVAYAEGEARISAGATVVLYTDGLVERRGRSIDVGFGELAAAIARRRSQAPGDVTDGILAELGGSGDDCALLLCRVDPPAGALEVEVGADARELRTVRDELREWLAGLGVPPADVEDVVLASGEALANSMEHGYASRGEGSVRLRATIDETRNALDVEVVDDGRWRPPPAEPGDRGRGFALMRALMERVEIAHDERGTRVAMRRRLHPGRTPPSPLPSRLRADDTPGDAPHGSVLRLEGDIDGSNAASLMRDLTAQDTRVTTVDLTGVAVLGSAAIQLLFGAARRLRDRGETLQIVAAPGSLSHRLLELTDLGSLCAVRAPGGGPPAH